MKSSKSYADFLNEGNAAFLDGQYQKSSDFYSSAIQLDPRASEALSKRASCRIKLKDYVGAADDAVQAFTLDKSNHVAYYIHGIACFELEEYESAFNSFSQSQSIDKNSTYRIWMRKAEAEVANADMALWLE